MNDMTHPMPRWSALFALALSLLLTACSPAFNWRDVRPDDRA